MSEDYAKYITLSSKILNEYKIRHISITEKQTIFFKHLETIYLYLLKYKCGYIAPKNSNIVTLIDLLLDFLAHDAFGSDCIENSLYEWSSSVFNKITEISKCDDQKAFDWFLVFIEKIKNDNIAHKSLLYFYNLSIKYGVYATHAALVGTKKYKIGKNFNEKNMIRALEGGFWDMHIRCASSDGSCALFSPYEISSLCDIAPDEDHILKGKHIFAMDIESKKFNIDAACKRIPQMVISAYIRHKHATRLCRHSI